MDKQNEKKMFYPIKLVVEIEKVEIHKRSDGYYHMVKETS